MAAAEAGGTAQGGFTASGVCIQILDRPGGLPSHPTLQLSQSDTGPALLYYLHQVWARSDNPTEVKQNKISQHREYDCLNLKKCDERMNKQTNKQTDLCIELRYAQLNIIGNPNMKVNEKVNNFLLY